MPFSIPSDYTYHPRGPGPGKPSTGGCKKIPTMFLTLVPTFCGLRTHYNTPKSWVSGWNRHSCLVCQIWQTCSVTPEAPTEYPSTIGYSDSTLPFTNTEKQGLVSASCHLTSDLTLCFPALSPRSVCHSSAHIAVSLCHQQSSAHPSPSSSRVARALGVFRATTAGMPAYK